MLVEHPYTYYTADRISILSEFSQLQKAHMCKLTYSFVGFIYKTHQ